MTLADHARLLIEYNEHANNRVLDMALALDDAALDATAGASLGSIRGNVQHVLTAQINWLSRWTKQPPPAYGLLSRDGLRAAYEASHAALRAFAAPLTDGDWDRVIEYKDSAGAPYAMPLGVLITHVVNHGTLHRGEAGMLLAAHGRSPGDIDFVYFVRDRGARGQ